MSSFEYVGNMHMHTPYSDGELYHDEIAQAAQRAKLDFIIVTDHNIYLEGVEGYYGNADDGHVLVLSGEEVHDRSRLPQCNHLLVYNVGQEMTQFADDPQRLIDEVDKQRGLSFLAHPRDRSIEWLSPYADGMKIEWEDWDVRGYTGLEIWNTMAVWKDAMSSVRAARQALFRPEEVITAPRQATLAKWDELLATGRRVVGIGNSDAHGSWINLGFFKHCIFPYDFLFQCVNTHILTPTQFSGRLDFDSQMIYEALGNGRCFIGLDLAGDTRGFRFSAQGEDGSAEMGGEIRLGTAVTLQAKAPARATIKIIRHGEVVAEQTDTEALVHTARQAGAYRAEVWREVDGIWRCWILSNPIYIQEN